MIAATATRNANDHAEQRAERLQRVRAALHKRGRGDVGETHDEMYSPAHAYVSRQGVRWCS